MKRDAIPGFVRDTWFRAEKTGDFYGQCAELCGKEHAYMPIHVKVLSAEDYSAWVAGRRRKWPPRPMTRARCGTRAHGARREGLQRQLRCLPQGRTAKGKPARSSRWMVSAVVTDADKLAQDQTWCSRAATTAHASGRSSRIPRSQRDHVHQEHWSNKTGQVVQPAEVVAARK